MLVITPRVCPHCGNESTDTDPVEEHLVYIGGKGLVPKLECRDRVRCWSRWDSAHGFPSFEEMTRRDAAEEAKYRARNS